MVKVIATKPLIARYQRLLLADWHSDLPDQVQAILWAALRRDGPTSGPHLLDLLNPAATPDAVAVGLVPLLELLRSSARFVRIAGMPKLDAGFIAPRRSTKPGAQAVQLSAALCIHAGLNIEGNAAWLRDLQALAFQAAAQFVLPALGDKHTAERAALLQAMLLFALEFHGTDPAHYAYLLAVLHGCLGQDDARLRFLYAAFRCTPPEDHTFLTKAEEYWTELLEARRHDEAERFLAALHWWALPSQQIEVGEMMTAAFKHMLAEKARSA
jgi:hypothetical protein